MLVGLGGYSPFEIKDRRTDVDREKERRKRYRFVSDSPVDEDLEHSRPEGDAGCVWDASKVLARVKLALAYLEDQFAQVAQVAERATDLKRNDKERMLIDRKFQGFVRNYDFTVSDQNFSSKPLFSSNLTTDCLDLPLDTDASRSLRIEPVDLRIASLKLGKIRVDTIVKARAVLRKFEPLRLLMKKTRERLSKKDIFLCSALGSHGLTPVDFEALVLEEIRQEQDPKYAIRKKKARDGELSEDFDLECALPQYRALQMEQKIRAEKKGRQTALLINLIA